MDIHHIVNLGPFRVSQLARLAGGLVALDIPPDAPALLQIGMWCVGRIGSQGFDRLALVWEGVKGRITPSILTMTFHALRGSKVAETSVTLATAPKELPPNQPLISQVGAIFAVYVAGPAGFDFRLVFPHCNCELWTSEAILSQSSYFRKPTLEDSDGETDSSLPKPSSSSFSSSPSTVSSTFLPPRKTITIGEAAYSTESAVVCWLLRGQISFGRLTSSHTSDGWGGMAPTGKITVNLPQAPSESPTLSPLPPLFSPKSVYRLAHVLEVDKLAALALSNYRTQLTVSNAADELFAETSICYDALGDAVLAFIVRRREAVFGSEGMKETAARGEAGELEEWENRVWTKLALALMDSGR